MIILYINHGFNKWKRFILFTVLQADSLLYLAQLEGSSVTAEPLEFQLSSYSPYSIQ